jgi:hypothetical protein
MFKTNKSGAKGVRRRGRGWSARITWNGKQHYLGTFSDVALASAAYEKARMQMEKCDET